MGADPCVYINLGHAYLASKGEGIRKAIALYSRAKKLKPGDLAIRLYLAKAHFVGRKFDIASEILSDALQMWPDDLLLRYNLAIALESQGVNHVNEETSSQRIVGMESGIQTITAAKEML